jgi:hypothetical protein
MSWRANVAHQGEVARPAKLAHLAKLARQAEAAPATEVPGGMEAEPVAPAYRGAGRPGASG